jgi:hypothetical protein
MRDERNRLAAAMPAGLFLKPRPLRGLGRQARTQVVGPVYYRVLITGDSVTAPFTDALADRYLAGLTPGEVSTSTVSTSTASVKGQGSRH